jgi:hypothetical protein
MSQPKRNKPIKIALTEEQIANIISEAAKSRRGLNVQSLEDRIAPSRFGIPVFGGAEAGVDVPTDGGEIPSDGGLPTDNPFDPLDHPVAGDDGSLPPDPNAPPLFDPANPDGSLGGPAPFDPTNPAPFDPASGGTPPWMQVGGGDVGGDEPSWFGGNPEDPGVLDGTEEGYVGGGGNELGPTPEEGDFGLHDDYSQFPDGFPVDELPADLKAMMEERLAMLQDHLRILAENGEPLPSQVELDEHRVNILTQMLDEYNEAV